MSLIYNIIFLVFTLYVLLRCIAYGIYEIKEEKNKAGGILFIITGIIAVVFSNILMFINV